MKKIILLASLLLSSNYNVFSQSGWYIVHPFPNTNEHLFDIFFLNEFTGFLATSYGKIYKSTNSGINFTPIFVDSSAGSFMKFYFLNSNTGFALSSKLYKTTDAGITWISKRNGTLRNIYFVNDDVGYGCGRGGETQPVICKTTNGGENWLNLNHNITGYYLTLQDIHFVNAFTGLVCGDNHVMAKTTNGGIIWINKLARSIGGYFDLEFINETTGILVGHNGDSLFLKTTDYGETWSKKSYIGNQAPSLISAKFTTSVDGYSMGESRLFRTSDIGDNWIQLNSPPTFSFPSPFENMFFSNNNTGFIVGEYCTLLKTTDAGVSWSVFIREDTLNSVHFINNNLGFAAGSKGHILKTSNGGLNWIDVNSSTNNSIFDIYFKDSQNGIYAGYSGIVGRTTNAGSNWISMSINSQIALNDIQFFDDTTVLIVGSNGKIFKSTNFGLSWYEKNSGVASNLNSISKIVNIFYSAGDSGKIIKSTDIGESWINSTTNTSLNLNSICFINSGTGYVIAEAGKVFKTINSGLNWNLELPYTNSNLNYINFINESTGFIIGDRSTCLKTTNGGLNWGSQNLGISIYSRTNVNKLFFVDSSTIYIVGGDGFIIKTTNGGGNTMLGTFNESGILPQLFSLHQNYPNPFNPVTKIKFDLPKSSNTKILIYDVLGKLVATLVNENLKPGSYEIEWDGSWYASGVYFYQLIADEFSQTKKMILMK